MHSIIITPHGHLLCGLCLESIYITITFDLPGLILGGDLLLEFPVVLPKVPLLMTMIALDVRSSVPVGL